MENWKRGVELSRGRGGLILTGHFGNWELMILAHSIYGNKVAIIHRPLRNPLIDAAVCAARNRFGNRIMPRKGAGREVLRLLRQNWVVGMPLDLDVRKGLFVDFFSLKASTSDGLARLAMATGAPVVPVFAVRDGISSHHFLECMEPIETIRGADREESVLLNTQRYTSDDRRHDPTPSGSLELDPSALENPPARRAAFLLNVVSRRFSDERAG